MRECPRSKNGEFPGAGEDAGEHGAIEAAGVGVAQRGVVAAKQAQSVGQGVLGLVGEAVIGAAGDDASFEEMGEESVPRDLSEADNDADAGQCVDLGCEMDGAVANLLGRGLVARRSAADDGADPGVAQAQAVVAGDSAGFRGEAQLVKDGVHEVPGAVAGEGATGAVGSVRTGSEAEDEDARARVAETGNRTRPVIMVLVGAAAGLADAGAVLAQAGTEFAGDDRVADAVLSGSRGGKLTERRGLRDPWQGRRAGSVAADRFHREEKAGAARLEQFLSCCTLCIFVCRVVAPWGRTDSSALPRGYTYSGIAVTHTTTV